MNMYYMYFYKLYGSTWVQYDWMSTEFFLITKIGTLLNKILRNKKVIVDTDGSHLLQEELIE